MKASNIIHEKKFSEIYGKEQLVWWNEEEQKWFGEEQLDMNKEELPTWLQLLISIGILVVMTILHPYFMGGLFLFFVLMVVSDYIPRRKKKDNEEIRI